VVDRQFVFGPNERDRLLALVREYSAFSGVQVITMNVLSNHFHLVLQVPQRPAVLPTDEELLQRIEKLSGRAGNGTARQKLEQFRRNGHHEAAEAFREKFFRRMWDLSAYMQSVKQVFTQEFNRLRGRKGTLWEGRYGSVLVDRWGPALATVACYVDLNSVRANLATDPKDYRWCGYAEAMAGDPEALAGLRIVVAALQGKAVEEVNLDEVLPAYRVWLYTKGEERGTDENGQPSRLGFSRETVAKVLAEKGRLSTSDYLRERIRYFTDGAVLGRRGFVDSIFQALRSRFGPKRRTGARRMRGLESPELYVLRDLRLRVFG
jgi:REP element-mobilizing transposase RayT